MHMLLILLLFSISSFALSIEETKHLLNRTSFGFTPSQLSLYENLSREEAVELLIRRATIQDRLIVPKQIRQVSLRPENFKSMDKKEKKRFRQNKKRKMHELKLWWLQMMQDPHYAFREKMTLFWHNHFTSEYKVVKSPYFMYRQNQLYREHALGNFATLLKKSSQDLAMLVYLDSNSNKKGNPNENYARELLELFTLGEGYYSEQDIKEVARAFTGYRVNKKRLKFIKVNKLHDDGVKEFMGKRGNFEGSDIINILLQQERVAQFITQKLYKQFVSEMMDSKVIEQIASKFRASQYDLKVVMRELLLSEAFWKSQNQMIKSPVELALSILKAHEITMGKKEKKQLPKILKTLGQDLFNPPNVKGWGLNEYWIDSTALLNREQMIRKLLRKRVSKSQLQNALSPAYQLK